MAELAVHREWIRPSVARRALVAGALVLGVGALMAAPASAQTPPTTTPTTAPTPATQAPTPAPAPAPAPTTATTQPAAASQSSIDIEPIIECSFRDPTTKLYNSVWGYKNSGPKDVAVPVGPLNSFDNPDADAGQPTVFKKGRDQNVFVVTHKGSSTWSLAGRTETAPGDNCKTNPVPVVGEGAGGLITIIVVTVVLGLAAFIRFRPRRA